MHTSSREIMSLSTLKHSIYSSLLVSETDITDNAIHVDEAKLNIMQATFVTLQSRPEFDDDTTMMGQKVFHALYSDYYRKVL